MPLLPGDDRNEAGPDRKESGPMVALLHRSIEAISVAISVAGVLVILWGLGGAVLLFVKMKFGRGRRVMLSEDPTIRQELGSHLLLGLEIFIAADVISSVASPSWDKVGLLAAIVGIRTVLSYFLTLEMREDRKFGGSGRGEGGDG